MLQGAEFLAIFSAIIIAVFIPPLRDLAGAILSRCPWAVALFIVGAVIFQANQREDAFIVAMAGGLVIILLALPELIPKLAQPVGGGTLTAIFANSRLRLGVTIGAIVLYLAFLAYPLVRDNIPHGSDDADNAPHWPVLALPAYYSDGDRSRNDRLEFQRQLYFATQILLRQVLQPLGENLRLDSQLRDLEEFRLFSEPLLVRKGSWRVLMDELKKRGWTNCDNVRLLLHAEFQENNEGGEEGAITGVILYTFLECYSSDAVGGLPRLKRGPLRPFRSLFHGEELDIFALKVSVPIIHGLIEALDLQRREADAMWKQVTQSFRQRYNDFEEKSLEHEWDWPGHQLGKEEGDCANESCRECAEAWKEAYEDIYRHKSEEVMEVATPEVSAVWLAMKTAESGKRME